MNENRKHCKAIAETLKAYYNGEIHLCPECGEEIHLDDSDDFYNASCPNCENEELEQLSLYDYLNDCYDIEYRMGTDRQLRSVCIMVACGGPNIYIDTKSKEVELYWWTEHESYPIDYDVCEEIDCIFEEIFNC